MAKVKKDIIKDDIKDDIGKDNNCNKVADVETVSVIFRENRKFDLHIGRDVVTFTANERKDIPKRYLSHSDWTNVRKYFVVKGV